MDKDTYALCQAVVNKINEQKLRIDAMENNIKTISEQLSELQILANQVALQSKPKTRSRKKAEPVAEPVAEGQQMHGMGLHTTTLSVPACACACGHENGCDLDTTVVPAPTTTLSEPIVPSEDEDIEVPFDEGSPASDKGDPEPTDYIDTPIKEFPEWDRNEFPVFRGGIELTPDVISKVRVEFVTGGVEAVYRLKYPTQAIDWILGVGITACREIMARYSKDKEKKQ